MGGELLGGVAYLEYVWPCWRKCGPLGANFEVFYAWDIPSVSIYFLLPTDQDLEFSAPAPCLPTHVLP